MVFPFSSIPAPTGSTPSSNRPSSKVFPLIRCPFENSTLLFASHRIILPFPFAGLRRRSCKLSNLLHLRRCGQHSSSISFKELLLWWTACLYAHYILYCLLYIPLVFPQDRQKRCPGLKNPNNPPPPPEGKKNPVADFCNWACSACFLRPTSNYRRHDTPQVPCCLHL